MAEGLNQPKKQPEKPKATPKPLDESTRVVLGKFDEKQEEQVKRIEEIFEKRISGSKMPEIALNEVRTMKEGQKSAVRSTFARFKKEFEEKSDENKSERDNLAMDLLQQAESEAQTRVLNIEMVLNILVKGDYITAEEAQALKRVLVGIERISAKDVHAQEILVKLKEKKNLDSTDYQRIIMMINPSDLTMRDAKPRERFEITTAGILIGFMSPAQRYELIEEMMKSPKSKETAEVIDGFLRTGILSIAQGEELFKKAVEKKIITEQQFKEVYQKRFDQGFYIDEMKKVREAIDEQVNRMKGSYSTNLVERVAGAPLLGSAMLLHSFFWILTNVLASGGDFKSLLNPKKYPHLWAAIGEGALALEITSGSLKRGAGNLGIGSGWISRAVESMVEKEGPKTTQEQTAFASIGEIYLSYPDFGSYLEHGGAGTILGIRKAKTGQGLQGKDLIISYDELLKTEKDQLQQSRLADAQKKFPQKMNAQINTIAEALTMLKIETQGDFMTKLGFLKDSQGLGKTADVPSTPKKVAS